ERDTDDKERVSRRGAQPRQDPPRLFRVSRMVGARKTIQLTGTAAEVRHDTAPSAPGDRGHERTGVARLRRALETMEEDDARRVRRAVYEVEVYEVEVGRLPSFAA